MDSNSHNDDTWENIIPAGNNVAARYKIENGDFQTRTIHPLYMAFMEGNQYIINLILERETNIKLDLDMLFVTSMISLDPKILEVALSLGANITAKPTLDFLGKHHNMLKYWPRYASPSYLCDTGVCSMDDYLLYQLCCSNDYHDKLNIIKLLVQHNFDFGVNNYNYLKNINYPFDKSREMVELIMESNPIPCVILCELTSYNIIHNSNQANIFISYISAEEKCNLAKKLLTYVEELEFYALEYALSYCLDNLDFTNATDELYQALTGYFIVGLTYNPELIEKLIKHSIDLTPYAKNIFICALYNSDSNTIKLIKRHYDVDQILHDIRVSIHND